MVLPLRLVGRIAIIAGLGIPSSRGSKVVILFIIVILLTPDFYLFSNRTTATPRTYYINEGSSISAPRHYGYSI